MLNFRVKTKLIQLTMNIGKNRIFTVKWKANHDIILKFAHTEYILTKQQ